MENNTQNQNGFSYTYSAKEQEELKRILDKYTAPSETDDRMERLRKLDAGVTRTARAVAIVFGIVGTLILGLGMSLCMSDFAEILGTYRDKAMIVGIIVGMFGGIIASLAHPIYKVVIKSRRARLAPEIIRLADEISGRQNANT